MSLSTSTNNDDKHTRCNMASSTAGRRVNFPKRSRGQRLSQHRSSQLQERLKHQFVVWYEQNQNKMKNNATITVAKGNPHPPPLLRAEARYFLISATHRSLFDRQHYFLLYRASRERWSKLTACNRILFGKDQDTLSSNSKVPMSSLNSPLVYNGVFRSNYTKGNKPIARSYMDPEDQRDCLRSIFEKIEQMQRPSIGLKLERFPDTNGPIQDCKRLNAKPKVARATKSIRSRSGVATTPRLRSVSLPTPSTHQGEPIAEFPTADDKSSNPRLHSFPHNTIFY